MSPELGNVSSLQTLTYFVVGSSHGCSTIEELQGLNLGGELELSGLQYVNQADAKACGVGNKEKLTHLSLKRCDDNSEELTNTGMSLMLLMLRLGVANNTLIQRYQFPSMGDRSYFSGAFDRAPPRWLYNL